LAKQDNHHKTYKLEDIKEGDTPVLVGSKSEAETFFKSPVWQLAWQFPYNPDPLVPGNNYRIYDEMLEDDQVKAVLSFKKDMVINTGLYYKCA